MIPPESLCFNREVIHKFITGKYRIEICTLLSVWERSLFYRFLAVVVFKLRRSTEQTNILQSHLTPVEELDLTNDSIYKNSERILYRLRAIICYHAKTIRSGHYTA